MSTLVLTDIQPKERMLVMDLVAQTGIDTSDWDNYKGAHPSANPRYCYEWAFLDESSVAVLNLWYESMEINELHGIFQRLNPRQFALEQERDGGRPVWARRARSLEQVLQTAHRLNLPIRVIVNEGAQASVNRSPIKARKVERRLLDDEIWSIAEYDWNSGECLLIRGKALPRYIDQFALDEIVGEFGRSVRLTSPFNRSATVREAVLQRAAGRCEFCGAEGFLTSTGQIYLETHHIVPLSENGADATSNVAALCPGHHREAHYGAQCEEIRSKLMAISRETHAH